MIKFFSGFWFNLKRVYVDILVLFGIVASTIFLPTPESGLVALCLAKLMFISAGIVHAHVTRKILWSYIDFSKENDLMQKVMIVMWYAVVIWGWARGG